MYKFVASVALILLMSGVSYSKDEACTDGVNCFCDISHAGHTHGSIVWCDDFENSSYDDGTGNGFTAVYTGDNVEFDCPTGPGSNSADEGTDVDDCFNIVTESSCDVSGQTDCVFNGSQAFGYKFDTGETHGIAAAGSWTGITTFGITNIEKISTNFSTVGSAGFKRTEWNQGDGLHALHYGRDTAPSWDVSTSAVQSGKTLGSSDDLEGNDGDYNWTLDIFDEVTGGPANLSTATATLGAAYSTSDGTIRVTTFASNFPGGAQGWGLDQWGCLQTKWTNFGSSSARVEQWWTEYGGATTKVVDVSGINTTNILGAQNLNSVVINNYFNGGDGTGSGYCTSSTPPHSGLGCARAYVYMDNLVVTSGDPVSCDEVFTLNSSTPTRGSPSGQFTIGQTTEDVDVNGSWQVDLQADKTADTACLVPCDHPETELVCGDLDTTGKGSLVLTDAQATPPRCVQAIAKNASGSSAVSVNKAKLTARKPADCNGDERITVSDIVCVNNAIFFGG